MVDAKEGQRIWGSGEQHAEQRDARPKDVPVISDFSVLPEKEPTRLVVIQ